MKIGFVLDDTLDSTDGVQQYILNLGDWLRSQKHDVHYLVGETKRTDIPNVHSLSRNMTVRFNGNRMSMPLPASNKRLKALLNKEQFDVVHVQMPYSPFLGAKIIRHAPAKTARMGTFHILPFSWVQFAGAKLLSWYNHPSLKRLDKVVSVSKPAQTFAEKLGICSEVLPNVVELQRFAGGTKLPAYKDTFTIVFVGRLVTRKGCQELLQAVKLLVDQKSIPKLKVIICGKGPDGEKLQTWVQSNSLDKHVEFKGFITETEKADYLKTADVAIFPSLGGESFGIVLIEAMAAGSGVVLGGNNPGYSSVLHELPETLFDPRDASATQALLQKIHDDTAWAATLHAKQQTMVKQYDVAVVGKKLLSYYQEVTI